MKQKNQEFKLRVPVQSYVDGNELRGENLVQLLSQCKKEGYEILYMPQFIDAIISNDKENRHMSGVYCTSSIRAAGKTRNGSNIVVYAHVPHNTDYNIFSSRAVNSGSLQQEEFEKLAQGDGEKDEFGNQKIFVVEYDKIRKYKAKDNKLQSEPLLNN